MKSSKNICTLTSGIDTTIAVQCWNRYNSQKEYPTVQLLMGVECQNDKQMDVLWELSKIFKKHNAFSTSIAIKSNSKPYVPAHRVSPIKAQSPIDSLEAEHKLSSQQWMTPSIAELVHWISKLLQQCWYDANFVSKYTKTQISINISQIQNV